jgi:mitogen-activated protein kinase kinase kinase 1
VKLYLLQQSGSNSFLVAGDEKNQKNQKYKVNIGPQTCSCNKGPGCLHILFIMLRVFGIPENDCRLTARELKEFEIEALFRAHEERKKTRVLLSRAQSMEQLEIGGRDVAEEDGHCPICLNDMAPEESLAQCSGCNNSLHHHCMSIWMAECSREGETVLCPLCRCPWAPLARPSGPYQHFAPAPYSPPSKQRPLPVQTVSVSTPSLSSSGYSTISRTSDTLHMIEQGGSPEDIPLPRAEPIPQQHWPFASTWIQHFGRDLVACLFSRDWVKRETGLRRLAREVVKVLQTGAGQEYSERQERSWRCCADMLAMMIEDKVYKVYLAAVKTLRALLNFLSCHDDVHLNSIKSQLRPLVQSVLIKCADSNRRVSEVSTDFLFEMCRGEEGEMALGKYSGGCKVQGGLGGLEFLLHIVLEERDLHSVSWQWVMGRLVLLERLLTHLPQEFSLETKTAQVNFQRLMIIIDFTFQQLGSSHLNISKLARKVFVLAAKNTAADNQTFSQVWELLGALEPTLQIRIRKKLTSAIEEAYQGLGTGSATSSVDPREARTPQEQDRSAFLEKFLNECSNQHTEYGQSKKGWRPPLLRSSSHSPSRQPLPSRSASQSPSRAFSGKPQIKKGLCQSVFNVNTQISGGSVKQRPNYPGPNKPSRLANRLANKAKMQDLATEILPTLPSLAFLMENSRSDTSREQPDSSWNESITSDKSNAIKKSKSLPKVQVGSRTCSPQKAAREESNPTTVRSPPSQKKRSLVSNSRRLTPPSSPRIGRECKDAVDYEESMALALALSKSLYLETPLSVIPGLSAPASQEVLAHPHRDMVEDGQTRREYAEGVDWTKSSVLGTGAYSTCYQARDVQTGTLMAAKQITFLRNSEEEQERVEQLIREEVLLISKLQHPHIVRMYGAIQEGAHINVFVEWMPGGSLASLLDKHGVFHEPVLLRYLHQTLLGLDYLHSNGILHRDLKGANVLVDTSGHHLRIADFGAAARMMSKSTVPGEFQGQLQGTIAFMAPEVLRGDNYGRSCDIWSLGCLIIEMATGKPPWGASDVSNHLALIFRIACAHEPPNVPETLSPALKDLTLRCLELDPNLRPSARELLLHPVFHEM